MLSSPMSFHPANHPSFTPWTDPASGVESFILTRRAAPFQKILYYTAPGLSHDGRHLWFYAGWPPSRRFAPACLNTETNHLRTFHTDPANPRITPAGDAAYVRIHDGIFLQPFDGDPQPIARLPQDLIANRHIFSLVTTITVSADGRYILLDSHIGNRWLISILEIETGVITPLRWFHHCHHHAMFSPTDPDLFMLGQGPWHDPITGEKGNIDVRMWVMDIHGKRYEPVQPDLWFNHNCMSCHEWWTPDGLVAWCDYDQGIYETDVRLPFTERTRTLVWPRPAIHADCNADRTQFVGDYHPYEWTSENPCAVWFFDRRSGREIPIASALPEAPIPPADRRSYHFDPHPHFTPCGRFIMYTTTALGTLDVAITPVEGILAKL